MRKRRLKLKRKPKKLRKQRKKNKKPKRKRKLNKKQKRQRKRQTKRSLRISRKQQLLLLVMKKHRLLQIKIQFPRPTLMKCGTKASSILRKTKTSWLAKRSTSKLKLQELPARSQKKDLWPSRQRKSSPNWRRNWTLRERSQRIELQKEVNWLLCSLQRNFKIQWR